MGRGGGRGGGGGGRALFNAARGGGRGGGRLSGLARNTRGLFGRLSASSSRSGVQKFLRSPGRALARFNKTRFNAGQRVLAGRAKNGYTKYSNDVMSGKADLNKENYRTYLTREGVTRNQQEAIRDAVDESFDDLLQHAIDALDDANKNDDD